MVIISLLNCPLDSTDVLRQQFSKLPPSPDYIRLKGNYCYNNRGSGIENIIIWDIDEPKMADALEFLNMRFVKAYSCVPGLTFSIFPALELDEAIRMLT